MAHNKVKNYLTILLGKVKNGPVFSRNLQDKYELYKQMAGLLRSSAKKHLRDLDDIAVIGGEFDNTTQLFKRWFDKNYELWKSEKCNILTVNADALFVRESNIFNEYEDFSLFGVNSLKPAAEGFGPLLNSVRYFPHSMEEEILEGGKELFSKCGSAWGNEMKINNYMFYEQRGGFYKNPENLMRHLIRSKGYYNVMEEGAWELAVNEIPFLACPILKIKILSFSATRGQKATLEAMINFNRAFNSIN